ncbi:MAG TPA: rRNA pseudouridine synthase [Epsilonproteobacteria bacterium]|nr:rRNA pseudouridine synthase [Campylobacterota bacterium]
MRINKFISHHTKYSRRDADLLIASGEVKSNRTVIKDFSYEVKPDDKIFVKGRLVEKKTEITVIVYNKPKGVLVTKKDDRGRATIYHKLSGKYRHFIPVGRLDYASEGLLILTNAPRVAEVLMNSSLPRVYNIKIDKPITQEMVEAMQNGIEIEDATAGGHKKSKITQMTFAPFQRYEIRSEGKNFSKLRVTIIEGQNRELRRFFAHFDATVLDLKRVAYGAIELNNLPANKTRYFTRREYDDLHKFIKSQTKDKTKEVKIRQSNEPSQQV